MKTRVSLLLALSLAAGIAAAPASADDNTWACEVVLCLANPGGPMEHAKCVPPIKKLYRHLAKGHSFPRCPEAEAQGVEIRSGQNEWEDCPEGYEQSGWEYDEVDGGGGRRGGRTGKICTNPATGDETLVGRRSGGTNYTQLYLNGQLQATNWWRNGDGGVDEETP